MSRKDWLITAVAALGLAVSLGAACRYAFRPRPVPAVPSSAPVESTHPNDPEPVDVVVVPTPEPDDAPTLCAGLAPVATLACVLAGPDLDAYSPDVLELAESAALRERLDS